MNYGLYLTLFGLISLNWPLLLMGVIILLVFYFYRTLKEESGRRKNEKEFNEFLDETGRLN